MKIILTAVVAILVFSSCQKDVIQTDESVNAEAVSSDVTGPSEFSNCKLRRIVHEHGGVSGLLVNGLFTYNAAGNPVSLTYGGQTGTNNPNHYFKYDKNNRLREWLQAYSPDDRVESRMNRYGYDANGVLIVDSAFFFAQFYDDDFDGHAEFIGYYDTIVSLITYDSQGRVVKEAIRNVKGGTTRYPTYTYDARGNLGVLGWKSSSYDYKVSIYRSHPVFQFIFRNYSKNNASPQAKYNSKGLPLSMVPGNDDFFNRPGDQYQGVLKAIYDCP